MRASVFLLGLAVAGCEQGGIVAEPNMGNDGIEAEAAADPEANLAAADPAKAGAGGDPAGSDHPCRTQDGRPVMVAAMRAVGTEPFWNARTDGRCVTYSTPEDQAGTRVWAKVETSGDRSVWTGALTGEPFVLAIRPSNDCSDGMSDKVYAYEAALTVRGEVRRGCAEKL